MSEWERSGKGATRENSETGGMSEKTWTVEWNIGLVD